MSRIKFKDSTPGNKFLHFREKQMQLGSLIVLTKKSVYVKINTQKISKGIKNTGFEIVFKFNAVDIKSGQLVTIRDNDWVQILEI